MKKLLAVSIFAVLLLCVAPLSKAAESEAAGTGMSGTKQDFSDLEKSLKKDRIDDLERRVADLEQTNRFLANRVQDVERTLYDFKSRQ